ncbi:MAG: ester cyclase [Paracoccaceae bacterium]|nr:ester cyclase [Paracoccaceae bacterium]
MTLHPAMLIRDLRAAMADFAEGPVRAALGAALAPDAAVRLCHPFGTVAGPEAFFDTAYGPLLSAWPDLERRDWIVVAGRTAEGADWIGCGGHYMGTFARPFLDIPVTGHLAHMRYAEFFRHEAGRIVEVQAIWDIPEVMMDAGVWPLAPSLGREVLVPGPASCDGLGPHDPGLTAGTRATVIAMLEAMVRHPDAPPEAMELPRFWHPRMMWYGPAGIGSARGIEGFRRWHQIPFLAAMPDRGKYPAETKGHYFAEGAYAAVTGWPDMAQTLTGGGWLGLPPTGSHITLRSLDFWRLERGLIRENWVLVDLLHAMDQIGLDAFARLCEMNRVRPGFDPETGRALP